MSRSSWLYWFLVATYYFGDFWLFLFVHFVTPGRHILVAVFLVLICVPVVLFLFWTYFTIIASCY